MADNPFSILERQRLLRESRAGNRSRMASTTVTYKTSGTGNLTTAAPIPFECAFYDPPAILTGLVASKFPDPTRWRYPLVTAGVWRWQTTHGSVGVDEAGATDMSALAEAGSNERPLYVGAWMFFSIYVDPLQTPRTDGADYSAISIRVNSAVNNGASAIRIATLQQQLAEAGHAQDLAANPPKVELTHYLQFSGVAQQGYVISQTKELNEALYTRQVSLK